MKTTSAQKLTLNLVIAMLSSTTILMGTTTKKQKQKTSCCYTALTQVSPSQSRAFRKEKEETNKHHLQAKKTQSKQTK